MAIDKDKLTPLARRFIWTDSPEKVSFAVKCLMGLCVVLFLADFVIHRHSYLSVEAWYGFYSVAGFTAFTMIVLLAKALRKLILRDESYYSSAAVESESWPEAELERLQHSELESDQTTVAGDNKS